MKMLVCLILGLAGFTARADLPPHLFLPSFTASEYSVMALDWRVGESASYNIDMGFMSGTMVMRVRELSNEGYWVDQDISLMGQQQKAEVLFDQHTGQVKRIIANGQEQQLPSAGNMEVVETKEDTVTVPAGTFKSIYVKILDRDKNETSEAWVNMQDVPVTGMIKAIQPSQFGSVTLELTSFSK